MAQFDGKRKKRTFNPSNFPQRIRKTHLKLIAVRTLSDGVYLFPRETRRRSAVPMKRIIDIHMRIG
jgi:hypothetical protein